MTGCSSLQPVRLHSVSKTRRVEEEAETVGHSKATSSAAHPERLQNWCLPHPHPPSVSVYFLSSCYTLSSARRGRRVHLSHLCKLSNKRSKRSNNILQTKPAFNVRIADFRSIRRFLIPANEEELRPRRKAVIVHLLNTCLTLRNRGRRWTKTAGPIATGRVQHTHMAMSPPCYRCQALFQFQHRHWLLFGMPASSKGIKETSKVTQSSIYSLSTTCIMMHIQLLSRTESFADLKLTCTNGDSQCVQYIAFSYFTPRRKSILLLFFLTCPTGSCFMLAGLSPRAGYAHIWAAALWNPVHVSLNHVLLYKRGQFMSLQKVCLPVSGSTSKYFAWSKETGTQEKPVHTLSDPTLVNLNIGIFRTKLKAEKRNTIWTQYIII